MSTILLFLLISTSVFAEDFSSGHKQFTAALYNELVDEKTNLVVSPFSLETVLALTQSGARDATGEEIRTTLRLPETQEETETVIKSILSTLQSEDYILHSANKIYVEEGYVVNEEFTKTATDVYLADFESVEFVSSEATAEEINRWVEEQTEDKIHDLIASRDLDEDTRLVLVNALYFEGTWLYPFDTNYTKKARFFTADKEVEADMMVKNLVEFNYYESKELDAKFLEVPFQGEDATMTFILPNKKDGISDLEKQKERLLIAPEYRNEGLMVSLPKFKIETSVLLNDVLQNMGIRAAFDPLQADFSGIAGEKGDLFIGMVKQKTFIDVNESGVAAAAATAVEVDTESAALNEFVADHPFMFYIKVKDVILFEGRVLEP